VTDYQDRWISAGADGLRIRGYYFPWGTKRIAYHAINGVRRVEIGPLNGKARIWGTGNPRYWASLDPKRPSKQAAFVLDLGRAVRPFLTPDDPDAFESVIHEQTGRSVEPDGRSPFL
jgi:hypothetical protein